MAASKISKNARRGVIKQSFTHRDCGGNIVMRTIVSAGKMRHYAKCEQCGAVSRRPKDLV